MKVLISKIKKDSLKEAQAKKLFVSDKIKQNLDRIHEKYKFITNYFSDIEIVGKLNGYEISGVL